MSAAPPTRRGQEFALKAEQAMREGKVEDAKMWHRNAWNAFKEARDALLEGDSNTKMALKILIDFHRDREKNPGDAKHLLIKSQTSKPLPPPETFPKSPAATSSLPEAWAAVQEVGERLQVSSTPPPIPESIPLIRNVSASSNVDWKKGHQSMMMAESYLFVGNESANSHLPSGNSKSLPQSTPDKQLTGPSRTASVDIEKLLKENAQLRSMLQKEREETLILKEKFWKMFALVKTALEESNHESDLRALTRVLHAETEARKKAEAELESLRRNYS